MMWVVMFDVFVFKLSLLCSFFFSFFFLNSEKVWRLWNAVIGEEESTETSK